MEARAERVAWASVPEVKSSTVRFAPPRLQGIALREPVPSNGDREIRRGGVGARIGSGTVDAGATDMESGAGARLTLDWNRAVNVIGRSHHEFHSDSFRLAPRNDFPRGRPSELGRDQVEREPGYGQRALPCLDPMPRPIVSGRSEAPHEGATAGRPGIDPSTARDRERLRLCPHGLDGGACSFARREV